MLLEEKLFGLKAQINGREEIRGFQRVTLTYSKQGWSAHLSFDGYTLPTGRAATQLGAILDCFKRTEKERPYMKIFGKENFT